MTPLEPDAPYSPSDVAAWCVMRVDDNANAFVVRDGLRRSEACALAMALESRGHKPFYWARRGPEPAEDAAGRLR